MVCSERGMALATVLFVLALLMVLALVLTDKVHHATRATTRAHQHSQALDAASAGIAWGRRQLAATYASSGCWHNYLATAAGGSSYPATPTFTLELGGHSVELFVRDNPDGDNDWRHDNDLQLYLLARLPTSHGPEAIVEALCGFASNSAPDRYRQFTERAPQAGPGLEPGSASDFQLVD